MTTKFLNKFSEDIQKLLISYLGICWCNVDTTNDYFMCDMGNCDNSICEECNSVCSDCDCDYCSDCLKHCCFCDSTFCYHCRSSYGDYTNKNVYICMNCNNI